MAQTAEKTEDSYENSSVIIEFRAQAEISKIQKKLGIFLDEAIGPDGFAQYTLFENEAGYSLVVTDKGTYIFTDPEKGKRYADIDDLDMETFIVWCSYFCFPEYPNYLKYNEMLAKAWPPQPRPTLVFFRERIMELLNWISQEMDELIDQALEDSAEYNSSSTPVQEDLR